MLQEIAGFILTIHAIEQQGETYLEFWLLSDKGVVKATTPAQQLLFFYQTTTGQIGPVYFSSA